MKLYVSHSSSFDFKSDLYDPLRSSTISNNEIFFPHDKDTVINTKEIIQECDFVIAEVSHPSTGQGIELGWADSEGVPIICFYKASSAPSSAISTISKSIFEYASVREMVEKLETELSTKSY